MHVKQWANHRCELLGMDITPNVRHTYFFIDIQKREVKLTKDLWCHIFSFLTKVDMNNVILSSKEWKQIADDSPGISNFKCVNFAGLTPWTKITLSNILGEDEIIKCLEQTRYKHLKNVSFNYNPDHYENDPFTDEILLCISVYCHEIETLNLGYCPEISDKGLEKLLAGCYKLKDLFIMGSSISDFGILGLSGALLYKSYDT
jgi:hypothetical protein